MTTQTVAQKFCQNFSLQCYQSHLRKSTRKLQTFPKKISKFPVLHEKTFSRNP